MYKCTDCGKEYELKPDYCDCGNNIFDEFTLPEKTVLSKTQTTPKLTYNYKNIKGEILSWFIFSLCIVLSVLSLIFIGRNTDNANQTKPQIIQKQEKIEIPSIDELWTENNTQVPAPVEKTEKSIFKSIFKSAPKVVKPVVNTSAVQQPKQTNPAAQKTQQTQNYTMTEEEKAAIINRLTSTPKTEPVIKKTPVDEAALRREFIIYKTSLRNRIAAYIDFASVIGDGNCSITFRIDDQGNLIDRKFSVQSNNNSLNDVVYNAMMQNPTFQAPPKGYKNEILTFSVKMYGGNFEVTLN